jgi:predicted DNA-binding transcriptional regulator AlpA
MPEQYLTVRETANYTGLSESYLAKLRMGTSSITGPNYVLIGLRGIRYRRTDIDAWMDARSVYARHSGGVK